MLIERNGKDRSVQLLLASSPRSGTFTAVIFSYSVHRMRMRRESSSLTLHSRSTKETRHELANSHQRHVKWSSTFMVLQSSTLLPSGVIARSRLKRCCTGENQFTRTKGAQGKPCTLRERLRVASRTSRMPRKRRYLRCRRPCPPLTEPRPGCERRMLSPARSRVPY